MAIVLSHCRYSGTFSQYFRRLPSSVSCSGTRQWGRIAFRASFREHPSHVEQPLAVPPPDGLAVGVAQHHREVAFEEGDERGERLIVDRARCPCDLIAELLERFSERMCSHRDLLAMDRADARGSPARST
jgi:hypothetical protein